MRPSNKSRSRNKNRRSNNNNSGGNILNRVYDSAGPDGRVRGTPQQVIEKYQTLTHDSALAGDRVAMENFQQHAEHYIRLINEAQRQINERREAMEAQMQERTANQQQRPKSGEGEEGADTDPANAPQPDTRAQSTQGQTDVIDVQPSEENGQTDLVDTPEAAAKEKKPRTRTRTPKAKANGADNSSDTPPAAGE